MANPSVLRIDHDDELVFSEWSSSVCLLLRCGVMCGGLMRDKDYFKLEASSVAPLLMLF